MTDADLLEYIERTPELRTLLEKVFPKHWGDIRASVAFWFHAHEQRILAQRGTEPVAWMWQNDDTGMTGFIAHCSAGDREQWQLLNKRRRIVSPLYAAPQPAVPEGYALDEGRLWSFCRRLLDQGGAISQDYYSGKYDRYEEYSARLDEAARERGEELSAMLSAAPKPDKPAEGVQEGVKSLERECDALTDRTIEQRRLIEDLASMCRRMSYALNRAGGSDTTVRQCIDLLKRHDLGGSIIRTEQVAKPTDSGREG